MSAKKYFVYELKKSLFAICGLALIMIAVTVAVVLTARFESEWSTPESGLTVIVIMGGALAAVVPIWMLAYKMKKRSVDLFYALPLKRGQVLRVKYILGLIATYAPYTVAFLFGIISTVIRFPSNAICVEYYFAAYFASLPALYCIYSIVSFVFTRAERIIDGIAFVVFWMFAAFAVASSLEMFVNAVASSMYAPFSPFETIAEYFSPLIETPTSPIELYGVGTLVNMAIGYTLTGLQAVAATVLLFVTEPKTKAEKLGGVSDSPFGYKVMIPLFTVCLFINIDMVNNVESILLAFIAAGVAFMATALYRHTFKIGKVQAIIYLSYIVVGIALSIAASFINGAIYGEI